MSQNHLYKSNGIDQNEMRCKRSEVASELRKKKREKDHEQFRNLPTSDEHIELESVSLEDLMKIVSDTSNPGQQIIAIQATRKKLLSDKDLIKCDILPTLIDCLKQQNQPNVQFEAAWAITIFSSETSEGTRLIVKSDVLPILLELLNPPYYNFCGHPVLLTLGNIIIDGTTFRDYLVRRGLMKSLLSLVNCDVSDSILQLIAWVIFNLCNNLSVALSPDTMEEILAALKSLILKTQGKKILCPSIKALVLIAGEEEHQIQQLSVFLPRLVELLGWDEVEVQTLALYAIARIVGGSVEHIRFILDNALQFVSSFLSDDRQELRENALFCLGKLISGNRMQENTGIYLSLLPKIVESLQANGTQVQSKAAWVICGLNIVDISDQEFGSITDPKIIKPLCYLLSKNDIKLIHSILSYLELLLQRVGRRDQGLVNAIEECEGRDWIEKLQYHENKEISDKATNIIEDYFEPMEE